MVPLITPPTVETTTNNNNNPIYSQEASSSYQSYIVASGDPYYRLSEDYRIQDVENRHDQFSSSSSANSASYLNELVYHNSLLFILATLLLTTVLVFSFVLACMVLVGSKRRNAYKLAKLNDLASTLKQPHHPTAASSLTTPSLLLPSSHHDLITIEQVECVEKHHQHQHHPSFAFTTQSGNNAMVNNNNTTSGVGAKTPLKEISISLPIAKPSLNESKPQLSIAENKMKAKTLIERRGSNNSLTLNINSTKKRITLNSPSKECSELDSLSKSSRVLTINDLIELTKENLNLYNEFYQIPPNYPEFSIHGTSIKNRYKTIIPNESTRVRLPVRNSDMLSSYINANLITGYKDQPKAYIAAQGPMSNTINDFWFMIWHERVSSVVMITRLVERNKTKCEYYLPENCSQPVLYENLLVTVTQINYYDDYEVRQITITCNNETRYIHHYWYTEWPDHNLPENPRSLIQLIKQVESVQKGGLVVERSDVPSSPSSSSTSSRLITPPGPILVHCSAGVGRTGCYLAISLGINQLDAENQVDIVRLVCQMRKERGGMIQTLEQYEFIYQVLAYYSVYYRKYQHVMVSAQASQVAAAAVNNNQLTTCHSPTMMLPDISPTIADHRSSSTTHDDDLFILPSPSPPTSFTFNTN